MTPTRSGAPLKVLLVEDNPADARLVLEFLRDTGLTSLTLTHADRLSRAVEYIRDEKFNAIILDLNLPDSEGLETFARTYAAASDAPILVLTGAHDETMAIAAVRNGAQDYLVKGQIDGPTLRRALQYGIERKQGQRALRESEERLSAILTSVQTGGWELDLVTHAANRTLQHDRIFGYEALLPEWTYEKFLEHVLPDDRADVDRQFRAASAIEGRWDFECRIRRVDGETRWIWARGEHQRDQAGRARRMSGIVQDITARKQSEMALRDSEERFRQMAEHIQEVFFLTELQSGRVLYLNPTFERFWGVPPAVVYEHPEAWFEGVHPEDRESMAASLARGRAGENAVTLFRVIHRDKTVRWMRARAFPIVASDRLVGLVEDITELRRVEEQATQAQKMEAIGRLAGGVAHDFNNLLTVIMGEVELMQLELPSPAQITDALGEIRKASERAVGLTRQLLAFSRKQLVQPTLFAVNDLVTEMGKMMQRLIGEDLHLSIRVAPDPGTVKADRGQIEQVLVNLVVNARDAMPTGGSLTIETQGVVLDEMYARQHPYAPPGEYVVLVVSDTGTGMTPDVKAQIFEPFFTTKEQGKGTGLGLATSYGIVKQAGGHIGVYSEIGKGTTFRVYLPRIRTEASGEFEVVTPVPRGGETILLVEDDKSVREVAARVLRSQGYTVLEAANGKDAWRIAESKTRIDLLLTDVVLPGVGGREIAEGVTALRPGIKVLFATGYTDDVVLQNRLLAHDVKLIQKPFTRETLSRKVREVLDAK